jgi:predicted small metal-binding protein
MPDCSFSLEAATKEELISKGMEDAQTHGMSAMSPDMMTKIQGAIKQT